MRRTGGWIFVFASLVINEGSFARAEDFRPLYRSTEAQAMGNAFTAIAEGEAALFYNPAALAGIDSFSFNLFNVAADVSNDTIANGALLQGFVSNFGISSLNALMGKNIYARAQGTGSVIFPGVAIGGIFDYQAAIRFRNPSLPQANFQSQITYGGQVGVGFKVFKLKKKKGELRIGAAAKVLWRAGGYQEPSLTELLTLNYQSLLTNISTYGMGVGVDVGAQFIYRLSRKLILSTGLVWKDIGDTSFTSTSGADAQKSDLRFGLAAEYHNPNMRAILSYDYGRILGAEEWRKKTHLGLALKFPALSLYAGFHQMQLTFGAGVDLWLFRFFYASYAEEQATLVGQNPERRHMLQISMRFEL